MKPYEIVVMGASTGGLHALKTVLADLPRDFPLPIVIVQHRNKNSDDTLSLLLNRHTSLDVCDAEDKHPMSEGNVYLAPPDYHLMVERGMLALSLEAPVLYARPSIDVLFESAATTYHSAVIGVILTGASADGSRGLAAIKKRGGHAIAQQPSTAEAPTMPRAAIEAVCVDRVLPLAEIGPYLVNLCCKTVVEARCMARIKLDPSSSLSHTSQAQGPSSTYKK